MGAHSKRYGIPREKGRWRKYTGRLADPVWTIQELREARIARLIPTARAESTRREQEAGRNTYEAGDR